MTLQNALLCFKFKVCVCNSKFIFSSSLLNRRDCIMCKYHRYFITVSAFHLFVKGVANVIGGFFFLLLVTVHLGWSMGDKVPVRFE